MAIQSHLAKQAVNLRYFRFWHATGWLMVILVIVGSLWPEVPSIGPQGSDKAIHFVAYAGLMLWFAQLYLGRSRVKAALGLIAMGVALEIIQGSTGYRYYEFYDMLANSVGVGIGWTLAMTPLATTLEWVEQRISQ